ncbi:MAG: hypothetical protein ACK4TG_03025 [Thermaurantiacus sp.]
MDTIRSIFVSLVLASLIGCPAQQAPAQASSGGLVGAVRSAVAPAPARTTIVLIDISGSIDPDDRGLYIRSLRAAGASLSGGDRLLVAHVGDATRGRFRTAFDIEVPKSRVRLEQEEALARARARVHREALRLIPAEAPSQRHTRLLEAIAAAAPAFGPRPRSGARLILLTDAVEESDTLDLSRRPLDAPARREALARARADGLVPDLAGVELHVIGAGGRHYASVEGFWRAWAGASSARLATYGRLPLASRA